MGKIRTCIIVDGVRFHSMTKMIGLKADFRKIQDWVNDDDQELVQSIFVTQVPPDNDAVIKRCDWLSHNGWRVVQRAARTVHDEASDRARPVGYMDSYIVAELCRLAYKSSVERVYLFSGSPDVVPGVEAALAEDVDVRIIGVHEIGAERSYVAPALRRAVAGNIIELADLADTFRMNE